MENLLISASPSSPEIDFRFDQHTLSMKGESFPENAAAFYGPIIERVRRYLDQCRPDLPATGIMLNVSLAYFNSSSTKMLFSLFDALNTAARSGVPIAMHWYHEQEDDTILEFGRELQDDFGALEFHYHPISSD